MNSLALAERGLDESTPDPPGGRLVRDDGRLNGWCLDAAMNLILPVAVDMGSHGPNSIERLEAMIDDSDRLSPSRPSCAG